MTKKKITSLDTLEKLVLNPKISKADKYQVFSQALESFPIIFIEIVLDDDESRNGIEDKDNTLIPQMLKILAEIRNNPAAKHYSGLSVMRNDTERVSPADAIIDFRE
ncbi:hypothetical protein [Flavobacterium hibisci]|uniref:hypothetical protein n=1 Tax=Flavobacterium hibisci TaxID=1914462 RepID=UPI001CC15C24|nr:hypothetical protein [Flavobacterium hibisci]MBZ4044503.1 hypothetical protein [Flavobacterium hibisci]